MTSPTQAILEKLKLSGRLPIPKAVAMEVISLTQRENTTPQEVARIISADPSLGLRVMKAANTLVGSQVRPVVTIFDAVALLGFRALRQLVLGISLVENHLHGPCKPFNYAHYWAHSLLTGIAVRHLTERSKLAAPEDIFTLGLLGDVGSLALAAVYPNEYGIILEQSSSAPLAELYEKERSQFAIDQSQLSAAILADMNFPQLFQRLVLDAPLPARSLAPEGSREWKLLYLLHLASLMADVMLADSTHLEEKVGHLRSQTVLLAIEESFIIEVSEKCVRDWPEWAALLNLGERAIQPFTELFAQFDTKLETVASLIEIHQGFKMRVLVVDDDRAMRLLLEKILQDGGHQVTLAANGLEALEKIKTERPQLIITDWVMAGMDGITLCRKLREVPEYQSIYVIVMTAYEAAGKLIEAFEAGADDYVIKPVSPKMFRARLGAAQRVVKLQEQLSDDHEQLTRYSAELAAANKQLQHQALFDVLTGLPNRRFLIERLEQEWAHHMRGARTLSCVMIDVDRFKSINDQYGHPVGDEALRITATALRRAARAEDIVGRYGGEEFLVLCPSSSLKEAQQCAERLRSAVEKQQLKLSNGKEIKITISAGVAEANETDATMGAMLQKADQNLYAAKESGRNCVVAGS
jgi:diguanylate cyclase (GGDEF)-like protein